MKDEGDADGFLGVRSFALIKLLVTVTDSRMSIRVYRH
jgi:hypothetical protein